MVILMTDAEETNLGTGKADVGAMVVRSTVGLIPFAGPVLSEIITHFIPNQRQDRITDYLRRLEGKLTDISEATLRDKASDPNTVDLFEEGGFQSARAVTDERRDQIAALVAHGISGQEKELIEAKRLLLLLRELDSDQIVILCSYLNRYSEDDEFQRTHAHILEPPFAHLESEQEDLDRETMFNLAKQQLVSMTLLRASFKSVKKGEVPEFDSKTGTMKVSYTQVSPLGRLLLRRIGLANEDDY